MFPKVIFKGASVLFLILFLCLSCSKSDTNTPSNTGDTRLTETAADEQKTQELPDLAEAITRFSREMTNADPDSQAFVDDFLGWFFGEAGIPNRFAHKIATSVLDSPAFFMEFFMLLDQDPYTYYLVDKQHPLPEGYEPDDLVPIRAGIYRVSRNDLSLRRIAADALQEMAAAAAAEGIVFEIGSTYRSAAYQAQVYEREVRAYGKETADRQSAQPGKSQHQLGLVVDFAPIDDAFAKTPASQWLFQNASRFGWSLSYPEGYEDLTGYRAESWHYRYVGRDLAAFIDTYFEGIQQLALKFIHAWQEPA